MQWVERLQEATGWTQPAQQGDWAPTEAELGVSLPQDYKELCARFEPGTFSAYANVLREGGADSLLANWRLINRTAEQFEQVGRSYDPFGLYSPAAGEGLILWGRSVTEADYYWHAKSSVHPDQWTVVARADSLSTWNEFEMSASEFL
ncbi:MAG: SMI1/KNR4 family protein, partial [Catenulispora sp.]|nr:SMI1/KNR4 family protein [Catenulispora sp.]